MMAVAIARFEKPRRTQAERTEQSDKMIMRAAVKLIAKQGYFRTTLAQIGADAGYSGALVSYRYGSKEGLLRALVDRIINRFWDDQMHPAIQKRPGLEALCTWADVYLNELTARESRLRALYVLMGEALGPVPEIRKVFAEINESMRSMVEECIKRGIEDRTIDRKVDPVNEAAACVAIVRGVAMQWLIDPGCFDLRTLREHVKATIRRSLMA
jgi:AcrR family transcriptional regulator